MERKLLAGSKMAKMMAELFTKSCKLEMKDTETCKTEI